MLYTHVCGFFSKSNSFKQWSLSSSFFFRYHDRESDQSFSHSTGSSDCSGERRCSIRFIDTALLGVAGTPTDGSLLSRCFSARSMLWSGDQWSSAWLSCHCRGPARSRSLAAASSTLSFSLVWRWRSSSDWAAESFSEPTDRYWAFDGWLRFDVGSRLRFHPSFPIVAARWSWHSSSFVVRCRWGDTSAVEIHSSSKESMDVRPRDDRKNGISSSVLSVVERDSAELLYLCLGCSVSTSMHCWSWIFDVSYVYGFQFEYLSLDWTIGSDSGDSRPCRANSDSHRHRSIRHFTDRTGVSWLLSQRSRHVFERCWTFLSHGSSWVADWADSRTSEGERAFPTLTFLDSMILRLTRTFTRHMSTGPTSHFITLPDRPVVQKSGDVQPGPLTLHYWEWKGEQPTVLFCHAASFHGRCYDRIINEALRGHRVIALDLRGHGRSQQHPPPYHFRWFGDDVLHLIDALKLPQENLIGIGHSVGGYALTWAAARASRLLFRSLLLLDPVILPPIFYENFDENSFNVDHILRRKHQWASLEEMIQRMGSRPPFSRWPKDVLRDYCTFAVDEQFRLRCVPKGEASIYQWSTHPESNIYPQIEKSSSINDIPIQIVRSALPFAKGGLDESPTEPELVKWFKKGRDMQLKEGDHLFPMERPQLAIDLVQTFLLEDQKLRSHL